MTKFEKTKFTTSGPYIHYDGKFVARFKHKPGSKGSYITFLIKNFTVEEFFERQVAYDNAFKTHGSPEKAGIKSNFQIAEDRGYIMPHIKKWLKESGYEVSREGYKKFRDDQVAKYRAA